MKSSDSEFFGGTFQSAMQLIEFIELSSSFNFLTPLLIFQIVASSGSRQDQYVLLRGRFPLGTSSYDYSLLLSKNSGFCSISDSQPDWLGCNFGIDESYSDSDIMESDQELTGDISAIWLVSSAMKPKFSRLSMFEFYDSQLAYIFFYINRYIPIQFRLKFFWTFCAFKQQLIIKMIHKETFFPIKIPLFPQILIVFASDENKHMSMQDLTNKGYRNVVRIDNFLCGSKPILDSGFTVGYEVLYNERRFEAPVLSDVLNCRLSNLHFDIKSIVEQLTKESQLL